MRVRKALGDVLLSRTRPGRRCVHAVSSRFTASGPSAQRRGATYLLLYQYC